MVSTSNSKLSPKSVLQLVEILQPIARATEDPACRLELCNQIDEIFARLKPASTVVTSKNRALRAKIEIALQAQAVIRGDQEEEDSSKPNVESVMRSGDCRVSDESMFEYDIDASSDQADVYNEGTVSQPCSSPPIPIQVMSPLEFALEAMKSRRFEYYRQPIYIPPMAKSSLRAENDESFPLFDKVQEFLESEREVMLILGDSGAGKSTFNRHLEHELWLNYSVGDRIPLFVNLPALERPEKDLLTEHLQEFEFTDEQIRELRLSRQFILICDGYDEAQLVINLHTTNLFNQFGQWSAKLVITCRTQYLGPEYRDRFAPNAINLYSISTKNLFQEAVITPFSKDQIETYVERYISLEPRTWVGKDYMDRMAAIPNIMDLVKNPFLLSLVLEALPELIIQGEGDLSSLHIGRVQLYDTFVHHWLAVNKRRLQGQRLDHHSRDIFEQLLEGGFEWSGIGGFERSGIQFQTDLALAIYQEQDGRPVVQYTHFSDNSTWKANFFSPNPKIKILREASLLSRTGNQHRFVHRSILEYFYSCSIAGPNHGLVGPPSSVADHPLSRRSLIYEPSIIQFLCERVQQTPSFRQELFAIIEQSKTNSEASQAAANAVTILFRSGCQLHHIDMQGIRIPGADLSGGELDSAKFQGADLTGVNFSRSWLRQADFRDANMSEVQFGEWPFLSVDKEPTVCVYSNDGCTLAVGLTSDIVIYDTTTWNVTLTLSGHSKAITSLAYFPSEHRLFSASKDGTWRVWNLGSGMSEQTHDRSRGVVSSMAVSPNGQQVATGGADKLIRLWFLDDLSQSHCFRGHADTVTCLAYSPNGSLIASGSSDRTVRLWSTGDGNSVLVLQSHTDSISSIAYAPDGQHIMSGSNDTTVRLWDASTGKSLAILTNHTDRVSAVAYASNGLHLVSASWDRTVRVWDSSLPHPQLSVLRGATKIITGLSVSPAGLSQVAACCIDKTVRLWDASLGLSDIFARGTAIDSSEHIGGVSTMAISSDGRQLATGGYDTTIRTCDASTGRSLGPALHAHKRSVAAVAFSPTAQVLASAGWDHTIHLWDTERHELNKIINGHLASITSLAFLPSGHLVSGSADWTVRLWDLGRDTQEAVHTFRGHTQGVRSVACSSDGSRIASASEDKTVRVWTLNAQLEQREVVFEGHSDAVTCVAFSPIEHHQMASASDDKSIRLWNLASDVESGPTILLGHQAGLQCVSYSTCGQYLASGSDDNSVIVWSMSSGSRLEVIGDVFGGISSVVWKQDVLELIVGCKDGSIRAWRLLVEGEEDSAQVQLVWGTGFGNLVATNACIDGVVGLSSVAFKLLKQLGAAAEMSGGRVGVE